MLWRVLLSNGEEFSEDTIISKLPNPSNVTPWLLLQSYCDQKDLDIKLLSLWDSKSAVRLYSPGKMSSLPHNSVDFRRRYISTGLSSNIPTEVTGICITKNSVIFGVWYNSETKEVFTSIEG